MSKEPEAARHPRPRPFPERILVVDTAHPTTRDMDLTVLPETAGPDDLPAALYVRADQPSNRGAV
jgi:hypothetical protein